ncbi:MAG: hypothetical protein ACYCUM_14675 [Solirubrobacteraceae bacterium]
MRLAEVSSHSFYELFDDKEECFLETYELIAREGVRRVKAAQDARADWRDRLKLALATLGRTVADERNAARFALVDAFAGGPAALARMRQTGETFEALLAEIIGCAPDDSGLPPLILKGIVAGIGRVVRARLLEGRADELPGTARQLADWAICLACPQAMALKRFEGSGLPLLPDAAPPSDISTRDHGDHRARLLAAVLSLAAELGYWQITPPRLRSAARVSRASFAAHFQGVNDCFAAALAEMTERALERTIRAAVTTRDWPLGIYRALLELCNMLAQDPVFARLAFVEVFEPGAEGVRCREEIMADVTERFCASAPAALSPDRLTADASVGAVWGIVHEHVATGRAELLPQLASTLCFLALAPVIGADHALAVMAAKPERSSRA